MTREEAIQELGEWLEQMIQHGVPSHSNKRKALATSTEMMIFSVQMEREKKNNVINLTLRE